MPKLCWRMKSFRLCWRAFFSTSLYSSWWYLSKLTWKGYLFKCLHVKGLGSGNVCVLKMFWITVEFSERTRALNSTTESACVFSPLGFSAVLGSQSAALAMPRASKTLLDSSSEVRKLGKHVVLNYGTQKHIQWSSQMFCTPPLSLSRHKWCGRNMSSKMNLTM